VLEDEQVIVSTNRGEPLTLNGSASPAAKAYGNIASRLQGDDIPLMDPAKERRGIRARVRRLMQTKIF
jgi:septum site-determining protein MinD